MYVTLILTGCDPKLPEVVMVGDSEMHTSDLLGDSFSYAKALQYYKTDSIAEALNHGYMALQYAQQQTDELQYIKASNLMGYIYVYLNDYEKSMEFFLESLQKARQRKSGKELIASLHGLARTHMLIKESEKAIELLIEAIELSKPDGNTSEIGKLSLELGNAYAQTADYPAALEQLESAYTNSLASRDTLLMIYILNNRGDVLLKSGSPDSAEVYLNLSLHLNRKRSDAQAMSATLGNLGEVYLSEGDFPKAIDYINKSLEISLRQGFKIFTKDNYLLLSRTWEAMQNPDEALKYYKLYSAMGDSLYNEDKNRAIEAIVSRYSREEKDHQINRLQQQARTRTLLLRLTLAIGLLFMIVVVLLVVSIRLRTKLHQKEKRQLDETIHQKDRELVSLVMQGAQKQKMLKEIEKTVDRFSNSGDQSLLGYADELKQKIKSTHDTDHEWETLKTHFERVHPDFFRTLQKRHPELSQNDLKLCAYTKINLTTKEIARILNISDRSVQTARYRIKKKMELPTETDLVTYISEF
jgi:tetratricopeptide (TPR) repeat protein/DNA-binding CsgD family transcriptional regulator